ncbi:ACP S-malonyltransferase [Candidatus Venteria ishoeyi]|uniref:ACP S-malonyltransferase n=1 Tax=Candidatus Venteria ishoeyi TaxID=1899563 RepID=UPI0025A4DFD3|nr:ACP S-malonyltransferase [Candidatus Venteria ishoeyi]MDM8547507.1 ACP S-malonyltransferase [Candidatus Venteria ishoeyi]
MSYTFIFPGQGSQAIAMLADLAANYPLVKQTFEEASEALQQDLWKLSQEGPKEALNQTDNTQPAMLSAGIAVTRVWASQNGAPASLCAGHSLGEYSALVHAGSLAFTDAVKLVALRGRLMQEAVPAGQGAMAAILGLDDAQVKEACSSAAQGEVVAAVNFNAPGQVVIAGQKTAVERAAEAAKQAGAKRALLLPVSVPSHCDLMRPAADKLAEALAQINLESPAIPIIHNVDVTQKTDPDTIREALVGQLFQPVRWVETIQAIAEQQPEVVLEMGPGKVLTGLNKRINKNLQSLAVFDPASLDKALAIGN